MHIFIVTRMQPLPMPKCLIVTSLCSTWNNYGVKTSPDLITARLNGMDIICPLAPTFVCLGASLIRNISKNVGLFDTTHLSRTENLVVSLVYRFIILKGHTSPTPPTPATAVAIIIDRTNIQLYFRIANFY